MALNSIKIQFLDDKILRLDNDLLSFNCYFVPRESTGKLKLGNNFCIYFLTDYNEAKNTKRKFYIGETSDFVSRMADHKQKKDWWNYVIAFCAPYPKFSNDVILGLERLFIESYQQYPDDYDLCNSKSSASLIVDNCYNFKESIQFFLDFLGYGLDTKTKSIIPQPPVVTPPVPTKDIDKLEGVELFIISKTINAKAVIVKGKVVIKAGSIISNKLSNSFSSGDRDLHNQLVSSGIIVNNEFKYDYQFDSLSSAAKNVYCSSVNGWDMWKDKNGVTAKELLKK